MVAMRRFGQGTIFLVPISEMAFARGVLARTDGKGRCFGYFFGPRISSENAFAIDDLAAKWAVLRCRFGEHALRAGTWVAVAEVDPWILEEWPLPKFVRPLDDPDRTFVSTYDDALNFVSEMVVATSEVPAGLPPDSLSGSEVVQSRLSKLIPGGGRSFGPTRRSTPD